MVFKVTVVVRDLYNSRASGMYAHNLLSTICLHTNRNAQLACHYTLRKWTFQSSQAATYIVNNGTISETVPYGVVVTTDH